VHAWKRLSIATVIVAAAVVTISPRIRFSAGGALVNLGMGLQDDLHAFDLAHEHSITPQQVWQEFAHNNELSSRVRDVLPRSVEHPLVALAVCMDARIDTSELAGDTRRYYYVVRTAGSILEPAEQEMLELAVRNGVKVLVLTRHTDCAAEKAATHPELRSRFPALVNAVDRRDVRLNEFLQRPLIREKVEKGELLIKQLFVDTTNDHLITAAQLNEAVGKITPH